MDVQGDGKRAPAPWGRKPPPHPHFGGRLLILGGLALVGLWVLLSTVPPTAWRDSDAIDMARFGLIGLVLLVGAAASRRSLTSIAVGLTAWSLIALLLVALYGYRFELGDVWQRVTAELLPTRGQEGSDGTVTFARSADQHFRIDAQVDGQPLRFLVDTGASGVVLTRQDATRLGYAPETLKFTQTFETANGVTRGAPIRLRQIRIGPLAFDDVPASVNEGDLGQSLLGMRLLQRLSSIEIRNDTLVIKR
jgi:aspartyl protease family protein